MAALSRDKGEGPSMSRSRTPSDADRKVPGHAALQRPVSEAPSSPLSEVPPSLYESEPEAADDKGAAAASYSLDELLRTPGSRFIAPRTEDARRLGLEGARALIEEVVIRARQPLVLTHCDGSSDWSKSWDVDSCRRGLAYSDLLDRGSAAAARRRDFYAAGAAELSEAPAEWEARLGKGRDRHADAQRWASNQRRDGFASRVAAVDDALRVLGDAPPTYSYSVRGIVHCSQPLSSDVFPPDFQSSLLPALPIHTPASAMPPMPWDLRQSGDPSTLDVAGNDSIEPLCKAPCAAVQTSAMVHAEAGATSLWVMTGTADAEVLAEYCATLGKHVDVGERALSLEELRAAPSAVVMYVHEQRVGDLVVLPPMAAAQIANKGARSVRSRTSHLTLDSLALALEVELPMYQRLCKREGFGVRHLIHHLVETATEHPAAMSPADFRRALLLFRRCLVDSWSGYDEESEKETQVRKLEADSECDVCHAALWQAYWQLEPADSAGISDSDETAGVAAQPAQPEFRLCGECYASGRACKGESPDALQPFMSQAFQALLDIYNCGVEALAERWAEAKISEPLGVKPYKRFDGLEGVASAQPHRAGHRLLWIRTLPNEENVAKCRSCGSPETAPNRFKCKPCHYSFCWPCILKNHFIHAIEGLNSSPETFHNLHRGKAQELYNEWHADAASVNAKRAPLARLVRVVRESAAPRLLHPRAQTGFLDGPRIVGAISLSSASSKKRARKTRKRRSSELQTLSPSPQPARRAKAPRLSASAPVAEQPAAVLADEVSSLSDEMQSADDGDSSDTHEDDNMHDGDAAESAEDEDTSAGQAGRPPTRWWVSAHASKRAAAAAAAASGGSASDLRLDGASLHTATELRALADAIAAQERAAAAREAAHVQRHHELMRALSVRTEREDRLERSVADLSLRVRRFEQHLTEKTGDPSNGFPDSSLRLSAAASLSALRSAGAPPAGILPEPRHNATSPLLPPHGPPFAANGTGHSISPPAAL